MLGVQEAGNAFELGFFKRQIVVRTVRQPQSIRKPAVLDQVEI